MTTQTSNPPVTTLTRVAEEAPLFEDQVKEYRQNQRRRYNVQRRIQRITRRLTGGRFQNSLEQQLDPQVQLRLSMQERAAIVPAEVLYHSRRDDMHHRVYMHRSEEAMLVTNNQVDRAFVQPESFIQLQRSGMRFLHMGVIQVRIQILHRQEEGTLALIIFRDNRWQGDQSIFTTMEVDLTHGSQLVYVIPETMLTISDFYQNIQVSILTRGYENWRNGEANLLITRGLVGRLSNTPNVGFAYNIQNVVDYLTSHGVRALLGPRYNTRDIQGHNWVIRQSMVRVPMQPTEVNTRNLLDGSISLQFDTYQPATTSSPVRYNSKDEEILSDEEEITNHTIAVLVEDTIETEELLVQRLTPTALLPQRKSQGAAGYDIAVDQEYNLIAQKQMSLTTGICIQVPKGTYARIASRSSYALQGIIIMGGVIDSDYRGEVKILAYNSSDADIYIKKQTFVAQLILERILTPSVREVTLLQNTQRGGQGFGSTTIQYMASSRQRLNYSSLSGGNLEATNTEAQYQSIPTVKGPYRLLDQYESLTQGRSPNLEFLGPGEKELRTHLEDIEWTAASHVLNHIWELKLILNAKEKDFYYRGQYNKGLYFKDALPKVIKTKEALLDLFIRAQNIVQRVKDTPP
ncbi:hypothetical protein ZIOFF_016838 [Zingiber officinale]|uniref:dUTP diphosphatase n=1 Tax=Zingiber officinale TaxID=94328 RepID=A0A8J5HM61_ZINOF|nr:hypothetical protein ZIOFF_016838 [Zingiber officinale]